VHFEYGRTQRVNRFSWRLRALLLSTLSVLSVSPPAHTQPLDQAPTPFEQQTLPPGREPGIAPLQQSPVQPPFSPLFGPYTPPATEVPVTQPSGPPPTMTRGAKAQLPTDQRERLLFTPSILVDESYTDNVFLDNDFKRSDFITSFTPGLLLGFRLPDFGVRFGYTFTSEIYAKETQLTDALARWGASVAAFYDPTPRLRIDVAAEYFEDNSTTASGIAGVSTGRTQSRGAGASPTLTWRYDPVTTLQLRAAWYTQSFDQDQFTNVPLNTYDTYTFSPIIARRITPSLTGTFQYQYLFSDVENGQNVEYHLLLPGVIYQFAPDFTVGLNAGPQITTQGQTGTTFAGQFNLTKTFSWGALGLNASRAEAPTGGIGGSAETNSVGMSATVTNLLLRGLTVSLNPYYTNSVGSGSLGTTNSINLQVTATYPLTRWLVAFLAYNYFNQRTSGTDLNNIDANRVTAGVQLFDVLRLR